MSNDLEDSFTKLLGRQPTDADIQQLYRVKDALGLKNNDAIWLVIMSLQFYQNQYATIPALIEKASKETLGSIKATADSALKAASEEARAELARAVAETGQKVAAYTARKEMWRWALGCLATCACAFAFTYWYAYSMGKDAGYEVSARELVNRFATCTFPDWKVERGVCFMKLPPGRGNIAQWHLK